MQLVHYKKIQLIWLSFLLLQLQLVGGGYFYFIKWKNGLLVADRSIQRAISAQSLNKAGYYGGSKYRVLTESEFDAVTLDDFNGQFKFSTNPQNTFTAANPTVIEYIGVNPMHSTSVIFQNSAQKVNLHFSSDGKVYKYDIKLDFVSVTTALNYPGTNQGISSDYTFLPCMEYVDNSKSTNIFY